ncbi:MAG TPA: dihydrofolate reductase family protein [Mycobacteriales bacterium]|nr:dihydrofolate reductase family protein [Mycobacteriales bacterium]
MPQLRAHNITVSLDGFAAGVNQRPDAPFGDGWPDDMHDWMFATRTMRAGQGLEGGIGGLDDAAVIESERNIGATIMGRNMFGPVRGPWDESWRGWWGENPPYHHEVFVLTHHKRPALEMDGGTTFLFIDAAPETVLQQAFEAAKGQDVRLGGGAASIREFMAAGLLDVLHLAIVPALVGAGERIFDNEPGSMDGYECAELVSSDAVTHARIVRTR